MIVVQQLDGVVDGEEFLRSALLEIFPLRGLAAATLGELGFQLLVCGQCPLHLGNVILQAFNLDCEVTLLGQFRLDGGRQSDELLLLFNESRAVGRALRFRLLSVKKICRHFLLQLLRNADDITALWRVLLTVTVRQGGQQRGNVAVGNLFRTRHNLADGRTDAALKRSAPSHTFLELDDFALVRRSMLVAVSSKAEAALQSRCPALCQCLLRFSTRTP